MDCEVTVNRHEMYISLYISLTLAERHQANTQTCSVWLLESHRRALACSMHTDTVRGVTGTVVGSERRVCLALLVQGKWGIEMPHRNLLVMERTHISLSLSVQG